MTIRHALVMASMALQVAWPAGAAAQGEERAPYCQRVQAEARSKASLLFAPRLEAQALRVPGVDLLGGQVPIPKQEEFQARVLLAYSPIDLFRGRTVLEVAAAECERNVAQEHLQRTLRQGSAVGRASALRQQASYLSARLPRVDELVLEAERRLERHVSTLLEVDELRLRRLRLHRNLSEARQELTQLEELGMDDSSALSLRGEVERYERATLEMERSRSTLRRMDAWQVDLRAGVVPAPDFDWLAIVSLSYNFGSIPQAGAERTYMEARRDELRSTDGELRIQIERLQRWAQTSVTQLREELALVERQLELRRQQEAAVERQDSERYMHLRALAELEQIELEAHRVFLEQLLAAREAMNG
jgi:hypothetical protein